jgi:hypothetical protein
LHRGLFDPRSLTYGARGSTLAKQVQATLASCWPGHAHGHAWLAGRPDTDGEGGAPGKGNRGERRAAHPMNASKAGRGGVAGRQGIRRWRSSVPAGEMATPAAIWGDPNQFWWRGGRGRDGGPPGQLDLARGGLVRWHRAAAMAAVSGARAGRRNRGRERACVRGGRGDRGEAGRQGGSYPLGRATAVAGISSASGDGRLATELLADQGGRRPAA